MTHLAHCSCGSTTVQVRGSPLFRLICHCTICQSFNRAPFADVTVFRSNEVEVPSGIEFRTYRPPPAIQRAKCRSCGGAAVEVASIPPITFIPSANFKGSGFLPAPAFHMFYERRVADMHDALPKHTGYWPSQFAFFGCYLRSLRR